MVARGGTSGPANAPAAHRGPFQGLGFYTEADAKWFFGRAYERKIILAHLRTARLTLLYAESGVGKSSLLRAGVAARLRDLAERDPGAGGTPRFVPIVFSDWKDEPVGSLISEIEREVRLRTSNGNGAAPAARATDDGLAATISSAGTALGGRLVIILDQFEEHFGYSRGRSKADRLADELADCINRPDVPANFLIAVREDAYGGLGDLFSGRISNVYNNYLHLEYLTREAAREAIDRPIELYNAEHATDEPVTLDDDLADTVLDEVRRGNLELSARRQRDRDGGRPVIGADEIETPFLQLVMSRLWEYERSQGSRVLRRATLEHELGGAETIVRNHVGRALDGLDGPALETATDIFHDLVTPSGVKVAHTAEDLAQMTGHPQDIVDGVLRRLYEERILRAVDPAPGSTEARYELFHDRLAAPILDWRDQRENERLERARRRAELEAQTQREQARRFKRRARIMMGLVAGLLLLLVAVALLLGYARSQSTTARRERRAAIGENARATSFALTTRAQSQMASRPDIALLLYLAAYGRSPSSVDQRSLIANLRQLETSGATGILHGHTREVTGVAFNPARPMLASVSGDHTVRLWNVSRHDHHPLGPPLRADGPLLCAAFDPTGQVLATGSFNRIILWNVPRHARLGEISDPGGAITSVAFARRGQTLAAAASDGSVVLWDEVTHREKRLTVSSAPVRSVALSPDGTLLAASNDKAVALYDVPTGHRHGLPLTGAPTTIYSVAFSPDGRTLAAGSQTGPIELWGLADGTRRTLRGPGVVNSIAFSPDGRSLAAGDGETTIWDLTGHRAPVLLQGNQGGVLSVAFSSNGALLASGGVDGTVKLWSTPPTPHFGQAFATYPTGATRVAISPDGLTIASGGQDGRIYLTDRAGRLRRVLRGEHATVTDVVFAPLGHTLAASYENGAVRLWNAAGASLLRHPMRASRSAVYSIAFDHTGTMLVSGEQDGTVRLWNVSTGAEVGRPLRRDHGAVFAVAFSADGSEIASGGEGRAILLWDAHDQTPSKPPLVAQDPIVYSLAFSPDGRLLAAGDADDTIRLYDTLHGYRQVDTLTGNLSFVRSVAFDRHGQTLASGSSDDTVRLWDVATGTQLGAPLIGHVKSVESVAFSPDGTFVLSGSPDGTVRRWTAVPPSGAKLRAEVCSFLGAGLSSDEWSRYAPSIPFRRTCPQTTPS